MGHARRVGDERFDAADVLDESAEVDGVHEDASGVDAADEFEGDEADAAVVAADVLATSEVGLLKGREARVVDAFNAGVLLRATARS